MNIDNNENIIGERIKRFRSYTLNMNQRQFAEALGIQPSTLSGYEKGNIVPSTDVLLKIASTYNISLDWLFGLSNDSIHFTNL
jgi:transcriptional regulator with XRE-family HTH domain